MPGLPPTIRRQALSLAAYQRQHRTRRLHIQAMKLQALHAVQPHARFPAPAADPLRKGAANGAVASLCQLRQDLLPALLGLLAPAVGLDGLRQRLKIRLPEAAGDVALNDAGRVAPGVHGDGRAQLAFLHGSLLCDGNRL